MSFPDTKTICRYLRKAVYSRPAVAAILILMMALVLPAGLAAQQQSFVYVNNQDTVNTVSGFSVSNTGALTPIAGSPFLTNGSGSTVTCYGLDRMAANAAKGLLFVSNPGDQTISVFQVSATTGVLTLAPGSPVRSGITPDGCGGMSLAATPDGNFLMVSGNGQIQSFNVAADGSLTPAVLTSNVPSTNVSMKISSNGQFLAVSDEGAVSLFTINADGSLTAAANSPLLLNGTRQLAGLEFTCAGDRLYGNETSVSSSAIDVWSVSATTGLAPITGSPFTKISIPHSSIFGPQPDSNIIALSIDDTKMFTSSQLSNQVLSYSFAPDGSLNTNSSGISAAGTPSTIHVPAGISVDAGGHFLYVADDTFGVAVFNIAFDGTLTSLSDVATIPGQEMQGVLAYPPRSCVLGDLQVSFQTLSANVETGSNVTYSIDVNNLGATAASATITDAIPAGLTFMSCSVTGGGACTGTNPHEITIPTIPAGGKQTITIVAHVGLDQTDGTSISDTATITRSSVTDTNSANDSATASFTVTAQANAPTTLLVPNVSGVQGGSAALTATLSKNLNSALVSGKTITFTMNGTAVGSAATGDDGTASLIIQLASTLATGTYPISASFAGDAQFAASSNSATLTVTPPIVNKPVLTVVPTPQSMTYGGTAPTAYPYTIIGFVNGDTSAVVSGTATCIANQNNAVPPTPISATSPAGPYAITCNVSGLSAANYTIVSGTGVLTINPAPLTVVVNDANRLYGDPNSFTSTVTGAVNGDNSATIIAYVTQALPTSPVGTYGVSAQPASTNYTVTSVTNGTLTITKAPLSLVINNAARTFSAPNPPFTGTLVGLKNSDNIIPNYTTTAIAGSPIGSYPITASTFQDPGFKLNNYNLSVTDGTLTITAAQLIVTAANTSRAYGATNPVFTGTIVGLRSGDNITATYSTTATATSPIGTYSIIPTLVDPNGALVNYTVSIVNGTLTVNQAQLTVSITNASRVYGAANPVFSGTISGLQNGDVITATYTSGGLTASVGTFPITPVFTDPGAVLPNYHVVVTGGVLTITRAPLTVTAVGGTRTYGAANPAATITGLKNGDNITAIYNTPTLNSSPNNYTLTPVLVDPSGLLSNYLVTTKTATLTITKAPLKITANSATVVLNTAAPGFTATYTGLVAGDTEANLTGTLTCTAVVSSVGTHPITCSGQTSPNYTITFAGATATVDYAPVGVCTAGPGHQILAPISPDGSTTFVQSTTTIIPIQFRVCDAAGTAVSTNGVVTNFKLIQSITGGVSTNLSQGQSTGFAFNAATQNYVLNLSTSSPTNLTAGTTYVYQITLNDGSSITFQFSMI
jgi:6-phosphogluconolactonase (cycloisomerase 2 family)